jgi:purine-binding chemotaxis protein CheW
MTTVIEARPQPQSLAPAPIDADVFASAVTDVRQPARSMATMPKEFLSFRLGAEEYGIDILRVQEIRSYEEPTRIANAPAFIKGVVNLRGVIVPIVDLRLKLGCDTANYTDFTVVIVLNVRQRVMGVVVDSVSDVLALAADNIKPAPEMAASVDAGCIMGIGCIGSGEGQRMLILTDIEAMMSSVEMGLMDVALH